MRTRSFTLLCLIGLACGHLPEPIFAQGNREVAPFSAVRFAPEVKIDGQWYVLCSIDGVPVEKVVDFARKEHKEDWDRRVAEDLVQILTEMGKPPGVTVKLVVRDPDTGKEKTLAKVPLTKENRDAIKKTREEFWSRPSIELEPEAQRGALDAFKTVLDERWSYRHANGADFDAAIAALRKKIDTGISGNEFGIELQKIISLGIDGHAFVCGYERPRAIGAGLRIPGGCLPFRIEAEGERVVAFNPKRTGFLADGFPYLTKIDGKDIADWCAVAAVHVPKGSSQYVRLRSLGYLGYLDYLRGLMKLPKNDTVDIELAAKDDKIRKTLTVPIAKLFSISDKWPRGGSRLLEGNIGYLRLAAMDENAVKEIKLWMPKFRDTSGLLVDVRDNGGGERDALVLLYSYLVAPGDPPRVFTAAAYRVHKAHKENHLASRFMFRADAKEWTEKERRAVAEFAKTFKPEWELPKGQFSDWHYMALTRLGDPDVYHYGKRVVVVMNSRCFSATDLFLAGLKGMKNVSLVGTPSGGGSAASQYFALGAAPFRVRIGSMASFQSNGKLFDGEGVQPDFVVVPVPEYHIGGRDNVLEEAVKRIQAR